VPGNLTDLGTLPGRNRRRWRLRYGGISRNVEGTKAEAKRELAALVADVDAGRVIRSTVIVRDVLDDHIAARGGSPTTDLSDRRVIDRHLAPLLDVPAAQLTPKQIDDLYRSLPLAPTTVRRVHSILSAALQSAWKLGVIVENPARRVTPPRIPPRRPPQVDTTVVLELLSIPDDPLLEAFALVAAATGCRAGELCGLQWKRVDMDAGTALIRQAIAYLGAGKPLLIKGTKTGVERTVALDDVAVAALRAWRVRQASTALARGVPLGPWVFTPDESAQTPWSPAVASMRWSRHCQRRGHAGVGLHKLRHWFASASLEGGMSPQLVARQLGHSTPAITLRVYAHVVEQRPAVSTLSDAKAQATKA
jgi:integrase